MFWRSFGVKIELMKRILKPFFSWLWSLRRVYWFVFRPTTRGVKAVITYGNDVLLIRNAYGRRNWTFPGGGVKAQEDKEKALKREVMEEVGFDLKKAVFAGSFVSSKEYKKDNISVYFSRIETKNVKKDDLEIAEAEWFPLDKMPVLPENAQKVFNLCGQYLRQ